MCMINISVMCTLTSFTISWFTLIHLNPCRYNSIQLIYDELCKGIKITIHKSREQHRRFNSQFNSPMIADTRFNSIPFNEKHDSTHLWCFNFAKFYFGNKLCNFAGLTAKIPYISECYTIDIEIQNEPATASFIMSSWEFPYALPWLKKWIVIVTLSRFLDSFLKIMDSDSLGIHVDWVKTQVRFIITAFHKAQLNSNSTLPAEPVDSSGFICELNPIQFVNPWIHLPITDNRVTRMFMVLFYGSS